MTGGFSCKLPGGQVGKLTNQYYFKIMFFIIGGFILRKNRRKGREGIGNNDQ